MITVLQSNSKFEKNYSAQVLNILNRSQQFFCKHRASFTVVVCAKLCCDRLNILWTIASQNFIDAIGFVLTPHPLHPHPHPTPTPPTPPQPNPTPTPTPTPHPPPPTPPHPSASVFSPCYHIISSWSNSTEQNQHYSHWTRENSSEPIFGEKGWSRTPRKLRPEPTSSNHKSFPGSRMAILHIPTPHSSLVSAPANGLPRVLNWAGTLLEKKVVTPRNGVPFWQSFIVYLLVRSKDRIYVFMYCMHIA